MLARPPTRDWPSRGRMNWTGHDHLKHPHGKLQKRLLVVRTLAAIHYKGSGTTNDALCSHCPCLVLRLAGCRCLFHTLLCNKGKKKEACWVNSIEERSKTGRWGCEPWSCSGRHARDHRTGRTVEPRSCHFPLLSTQAQLPSPSHSLSNANPPPS